MTEFNFRFKAVIFCPVTAADFAILDQYVQTHPAIQVSTRYLDLNALYLKGTYALNDLQKSTRLSFWFDLHSEALSFTSWYNSLSLIKRHPTYTCFIQEVVPEYRAVIPRPPTIEQFHKLMFLPTYYSPDVVFQTLGVRSTREMYVKQKELGNPINLYDFDREYVYYSHDYTWLESFATSFAGVVTRYR